MNKLEIETITNVYYKCPLCNSKYKEKEKAERCLQNHPCLKDLTITHIYYNVFEQKLPTNINILDKNTNLVGYYRLIGMGSNKENKTSGVSTFTPSKEK